MSVSMAPAGPSTMTRASDEAGIGRISGGFTGQPWRDDAGPRPAESDAQALDDAAVLKMLADDLVDVVLVDVGVPDGVGIDHNTRPFLAAVKAPRLVDAHFTRSG